jgi:hypothetical protein
VGGREGLREGISVKGSVSIFASQSRRDHLNQTPLLPLCFPFASLCFEAKSRGRLRKLEESAVASSKQTWLRV